MNTLVRSVEALKRSWISKALIVVWVITLSLGYRAQDVVDIVSFKTDDLVVTSSATVGTTLGVTGLSTLSGGFNSTSATAKMGAEQSQGVQTDASVGTVNNFVINATTRRLVWSGVTPLTVTGFKCGGVNCAASDDGRMLHIDMQTPAQQFITNHEDANSSPSNRIKNTGAMAASAIGANSSLDYTYDGSALRWAQTGQVSARTGFGLAINGATTIANTFRFTVGSGTTELQSDLVFTGGTTGKPHILSQSQTVTISLCGGGVITASGTDVAGRITTGTVNTGCTVTFSKAFLNPPACVCSTENPDATFVCTPSLTQLVVTYAANTNNIFDYVCIGFQ